MLRYRWILTGVLLMGLINGFGGCSGKEETPKFVNEASYESEVQRQQILGSATLATMQGQGVTDSTTLIVDFNFDTNSQAKAESLAAQLRKLGYTARIYSSSTDRGVLCLNGSTGKMRMDEKTVLTWLEKMCRLGFEHDCLLVGWGAKVTP